MKKLFAIAAYCMFSVLLFSQENEEKKYALSTVNSSVGVSLIQLSDPYLSPINYNGIGVNNKYESRSYLKPEDTNLSVHLSANDIYALTSNPTGTALIAYLAGNLGCGLSYHIRPKSGLQILLGGLWDLEGGLKLNDRNVNNPFNMDLATNLNATARMNYNFRLFRKNMSLNIAIQTPLIGCMFVPPRGASYYEIMNKGDFSNTLHFSSLHNRQGLRQMFVIEIPSKNTTTRIGFDINELKYKANDMIFSNSQIGFTIGSTFDMATFMGTKNPAPKNFISTKE